MRKRSLRRRREWARLSQGVREGPAGHEKFILVLWGGWVLRGRGHAKEGVLSLGPSQRCSGPLSLEGNILVRFLSRDPRRPFPEDAVIDEGVAQILRGALVTILLLGKGEPELRLGLLSFFYSISTRLSLGQSLSSMATFPSPLIFPKWPPPPQPPARAARLPLLLREFRLLGHVLSSPYPRVTSLYNSQSLKTVRAAILV